MCTLFDRSITSGIRWGGVVDYGRLRGMVVDRTNKRYTVEEIVDYGRWDMVAGGSIIGPFLLEHSVYA